MGFTPPKGDELLRYLNILDTLAYESLEFQLKFIKETIQNPKGHQEFELKMDTREKFSIFNRVKWDLLRLEGFMDVNVFELSDKPYKNEAHYIIRRCNMVLFSELLSSKFESRDLQGVNYHTFFDYIVPPNMAKSKEILDLDLNFKVHLYISRNKDIEAFPEVEGLYKEKLRNIIKCNCNSEAVDTCMKEFKWENFVKKMWKFLFKISNDLDKPLLYEYTSIRTSSVSPSSNSTVESTSRKNADGNAEQDQERTNDKKRICRIDNTDNTGCRDGIKIVTKRVKVEIIMD